jgi:hypothetical protein
MDANKNKMHCREHYMFHCFYTINIFYSYVFLSIEKIKFKGYIINNVSDDIIEATKQETCSKS